MVRSLNVLKKTGFTIIDNSKPVIIRDNRGILFYSTESIVPRAKKFNLPVGTYIVDSGSFKELPFPVNYKLVSLPPPERHWPSPKNFKISFGVNPSKCTVDWNKKTILFDYSLKEKPKYVLDFILFHEYAHAFYKTELYCDLLAGNYMKIRGYNPRQIGYAPIESLSYHQNGRKQVMTNKLIKANGNR